MSELAFSTAGATVQYAVELTGGTRPTAGYKVIPGIKSTPDLDPSPSNLDATPLSEPLWKRYIPGLRDVGGALQFNANNTNDFQAAWDALVTAAETARAAGKAMWFAIVVPGLENAFYFSGVPSPLGVAAMDVDAVAGVSGYIMPNEVAGWAVKPTAA